MQSKPSNYYRRLLISLLLFVSLVGVVMNYYYFVWRGLVSFRIHSSVQRFPICRHRYDEDLTNQLIHEFIHERCLGREDRQAKQSGSQ